MPPRKNPPVVYAKADQGIGHNGQIFTLRKGDPWDGDDPVVLAHPEAFADVPPDDVVKHSVPRAHRAPAGVEQATAAPGEKRNR